LCFSFYNKGHRCYNNCSYHTVGTVPKYHTVGTVPKYHTIRTVPKYHTVGTVPKFNRKLLKRSKIDTSKTEIIIKT
jgi:hypothetical protein